MINLIPNQEKKEMRKGFYLRLLVLFLLVGSAAIFIALVAILPSYFISSVRSNVIDAKLETQKNEPIPSPDQATLAVIKDLDKKLDLIEYAEKNKFIVSNRIINNIVLKKLPAIKITDISYLYDIKNDPITQKVVIEGTAPSRELLLLFRKALEDDSAFKKVDLPISNFVKGSNIHFYLSLIPKYEK